MAKKHKHEEHLNHERWLVSYADMVTLLFALFVVLYAMGVTQLEKMKLLKESIQFAFHIAGEGKTNDTGIFNKRQGAGEVPEPAPLINAQDGPMKEFLKQELKQQFEEVTGRSLDIQMTNDTMRMRAPLSTFFPAGAAGPIKKEVLPWIGRALQGSLQFTAVIRITISAPDVPVGEVDGRKVTSLWLCMQRLWTLRRQVLSTTPEVRPHMVHAQLSTPEEVPAPPGSAAALRHALDWEDQGEVILEFSNGREK